MSEPTAQALAALIEKHARIAVIPIQAQNDSYQPTPYETNALKNWRHILGRFAHELFGFAAAGSPPSPEAEILKARLTAFTEVHERWHFENDSEESFDLWMHEQINACRKALPAPPSQEPEK